MSEEVERTGRCWGRPLSKGIQNKNKNKTGKAKSNLNVT